MKGDRELIAMRRAGQKPSVVWVSDFPRKTMDGLTVCVHGDTPELLDLRFLVGVTVLAESSDQRRLERLVEACKAHAKRVVGTQFDGRDVVRIIDTAGHMTWQA